MSCTARDLTDRRQTRRNRTRVVGIGRVCRPQSAAPPVVA
jgi:hypothetical protein